LSTLAKHCCRFETSVDAQAIEEVFVRSASVWELRLGGQTILSTGEHPVFVAGRGWQALHTVQVGDLLQCDDGGWQRVDGVRDTGDWQTVYNVRVSNWHTYFVVRLDRRHSPR
jgi:hypothetical protein